MAWQRTRRVAEVGAETCRANYRVPGGTPKDLSNERLAYLEEDLEAAPPDSKERAPADGTEADSTLSLRGGPELRGFELGFCRPT